MTSLFDTIQKVYRRKKCCGFKLVIIVPRYFALFDANVPYSMRATSMKMSDKTTSEAGDFWLQNSYEPIDNGRQWTDGPSPVTPTAPGDDHVTSKKGYKHVPHKDRPPLVVARRNARERRRVQAVNTAFMKLRKIVPVVSNRGKRVSKVKTLQTAIDYINSLEALLKEADIFHHNVDIYSNYRCYQSTEDLMDILDEFDEEF